MIALRFQTYRGGVYAPPGTPYLIDQVVHLVSLSHTDTVTNLDHIGLKQGGLFDPVWVTGKIKAQSMVKDLFFVDGSANVDIGYTLQADRIEPYQQ